MKDRIKELKELIRVLTPNADAGHIQSQQMVINAQIELDERLDNEKAQETFMKFLLAKPKNIS
tara:strand:- start:1598 stop:1786 length:189 start_codon:yes stop_codon:yes gene_type:complete